MALFLFPVPNFEVTYFLDENYFAFVCDLFTTDLYIIFFNTATRKEGFVQDYKIVRIRLHVRTIVYNKC